MQYVSTRGAVAPHSFSETSLAGLAPGGGLFVPEEYPKFTSDDLRKLRGKPYGVVAEAVFRRYMTDIPKPVRHAVIEGAYNFRNFGTEDIAPVHWLDDEFSLLNLSNGPTLAFKDMALQPMAALMEHVLGERGGELNVVGATSGDTGSAAAYALRGKSNIRLFMLSPKDRMSPFQQRQMHTVDDPRIFNLVVEGTFDDCQHVAKLVTKDESFREEYSIGGINSYNWARITIQIVYYVWAWLQVTTSNTEKVRFAVPSGNFGNALSAHIARMMGLPIEIIVCTNANDVLHELFTTGVYRKRQNVLVTSSPSMDIAEASNFERLLHDYTGLNPEAVMHCLRQLEKTGQFNLNDRSPGEVFGITSGRATDAEVLETIRYVYKTYETVIDPHTAVAMKVALDRRTTGMRTVVVETAQAAKFEETIFDALGFRPPVPAEFARLGDLELKVHHIDANPEQLKAFIAAHV